MRSRAARRCRAGCPGRGGRRPRGAATSRSGTSPARPPACVPVTPQGARAPAVRATTGAGRDVARASPASSRASTSRSSTRLTIRSTSARRSSVTRGVLAEALGRRRAGYASRPAGCAARGRRRRRRSAAAPGPAASRSSIEFRVTARAWISSRDAGTGQAGRPGPRRRSAPPWSAAPPPVAAPRAMTRQAISARTSEQQRVGRPAASPEDVLAVLDVVELLGAPRRCARRRHGSGASTPTTRRSRVDADAGARHHGTPARPAPRPARAVASSAVRRSAFTEALTTRSEPSTTCTIWLPVTGIGSGQPVRGPRGRHLAARSRPRSCRGCGS